MTDYSPPAAADWAGRATPPAAGPQYWYQTVQFLDARQPATAWPAATHALLGYACDEGVRRNQGRPGAAEGPAVARAYLGKIAAHFGPGTALADAGTVVCPAGDLESTQTTYAGIVTRLRLHGILPIGIGGGHDIAYATYSGLRAALPPGRIGILNFDAHFDLRPPVDGPNSGTPFHQILTAHGERTAYAVVGIQRVSNTPSLFAAAERFGVSYVEHTACGSDPASREGVMAQLRPFLKRCDHLYVTVDLDGFSAAFAPGVSAVSPVGFTPGFFFPVFRAVLASGKVRGLDIAEFNPALDRDGITSRLLGQVVAAAVG